jgi:ABC-type uncharacterized transport system substrate-binding protein
LNVLGSALLFSNRQVIIERTMAVGLPAIYQWPENAREGGLIGCGPSIVRIYGEQMSRLAVKILRGAKPSDLPVEQPDKIELMEVVVERCVNRGLSAIPILSGGHQPQDREGSRPRRAAIAAGTGRRGD